MLFPFEYPENVSLTLSQIYCSGAVQFFIVFVVKYVLIFFTVFFVFFLSRSVAVNNIQGSFAYFLTSPALKQKLDEVFPTHLVQEEISYN